MLSIGSIQSRLQHGDSVGGLSPCLSSMQVMELIFSDLSEEITGVQDEQRQHGTIVNLLLIMYFYRKVL